MNNKTIKKKVKIKNTYRKEVWGHLVEMSLNLGLDYETGI
jgi:hypothetical protein